MSDAIEPIVNALDIPISYVQPAADARVEELPADRSTDEVAAGNARHASRQSARGGGNQLQMALVHQETAARQQELVGDGESDDAYDQERKDRDVAIGRDPLEDSVFQ